MIYLVNITFGGIDPYPTLLNRASILFYLMIKSHPFQNGNKRIALTTLFLFLYRNGKWLKVKDSDLYQIAIMVAESDPRMKNKMVELIEKFFAAFISDYVSSDLNG